MSAPENSVLDLFETLHNIGASCVRLTSLASRMSNSRSPIIALAGRHIAAQVGDVRRMVTEIRAAIDHAKGNGPFQVNSLGPVKQHLIQVLDVLMVCTHEETDLYGDDGALNAAYASMVAGKQHQCASLQQTFKLQHSSNDIIRALSALFGPEAAAKNRSWGLPGVQPPSEAAILADIGHVNLGAGYTSTLSSYIPNSSDRLPLLHAFRDCYRSRLPRYVRSYHTFDELPYDFDKSVAPASGSFGTVRKVVYRHTGQQFAAKSFNHVILPSDRKKIMRELGCLELCEHPNLIALCEAYIVDEDPDTITFIMSPWAPVTLLEFLLMTAGRQKNDFPWFKPNDESSSKRINDMILQLTRAVDYLHSRSIKHKDIKPANILLHQLPDGRVRPILTDVGETKVYRLGGSTDPMRSTYEYLAPEQLAGEDAKSTLKADIWQLGCCFAMMLVVAKMGRAGTVELWESFTGANRSCNIAQEADNFMATVARLCLPGSAALERIHAVVVCMLDLDPETRLGIEDVRNELEEN